MSSAKVFGSHAKRPEDPALLTGNGRFIDGIDVTGLKRVAYVRCPFHLIDPEGFRVLTDFKGSSRAL